MYIVPKTAPLVLLQHIYCDHFKTILTNNTNEISEFELELDAYEDFHISLSQPFALKSHQIDGYIVVLGKAIEKFLSTEIIPR